MTTRVTSAMLICASAFVMAGCSSIRGAPKRIIPTKATVAIAAFYPIDASLINFASSDAAARKGLSRREYRDLVVTVYLHAIDARYGDFKSALSGEARETGLGFDLAVLGLTSGASVAGRSVVNELSAVAAAFAGSRIAIDKNLYFERSVPAIIAALDAERLRTKAAIMTNLQGSEAAYPLSAAFGDLAEYELGGSLDRAIDQVTSAAVAERDEARQEYRNALQACDSTEDRADAIFRVTKFAGSLEDGNKQADLVSLVQLLGLDGTGTSTELVTKVRREVLTGYCTNARLETLIAKIRAETWGGSI